MNQQEGDAAEVAVAIGLIRRDDSYLVGRREAAAVLGGYAEFPGGKCLPHESPEDCVRRECREETGLEVTVLGRRRVVTQDYPHGLIRLTFFDCAVREESEPRPPFRWVPVQDLGELRFPEANREVVEELVRSAG
jgi:mutator protein MutT